MKTRIIALLPSLAVLALSARVVPVVTGNQDAPLYLGAAQGFEAQGLKFQYDREPFYPLFLAGLKTVRIAPERNLPVVQSVLFIAALYFFLAALLGPLHTPRRTFALAGVVALIPTFLITVNGAVYTESVSIVFLLVMLGSMTRLGGGLARSGAGDLSTALPWLAIAIGASAALGLVKGSFAYINLGFGVAAGIVLVGRARGARGRIIAALACLAIGVAGLIATDRWLASRTPPLEMYARGGGLLLGRTTYALQFDYRKDTARYLVGALSASAYRRFLGSDLLAYTWEAEVAAGRSRVATGTSERARFEIGLEDIKTHPLRELAYSPLALTRLILHHGTTGFANLELPLVGAASRSWPMAVLLKLFNLALFLVLPACAIALRLKKVPLGELWRAWPVSLRTGTLLYCAYSVCYLAVYSFTPTVVRMAFPVAPLLIVVSVQVAATTVGLLRSRPKVQCVAPLTPAK